MENDQTLERGIALTVVLDQSGSMRSLQETVVTEVNRLIDSVLADDPTATITIVAFNDDSPFDVIVDHTSGMRHPRLDVRTYQPAGRTPLFDAVGRALRWLDVRPQDRRVVREDRATLFAVVTDGQENASRSFSVDDVAGMIERRRARGWEFCFLGVPETMWDARRLGFTRDEFEQWEVDHAGTQAAFSLLADRTHVARTRNSVRLRNRPHAVDSPRPGHSRGPRS